MEILLIPGAAGQRLAGGRAEPGGATVRAERVVDPAHALAQVRPGHDERLPVARHTGGNGQNAERRARQFREPVGCGQRRTGQRGDAPGRHGRGTEAVAAVFRLDEQDLRPSHPRHVNHAARAHRHLRGERVAGQCRPGGLPGRAHPGRPAVGAAREGQRAHRRVVPHGVDVPPVGARRAVVARGPLLVVARAGVDQVGRAPGPPAVTGPVDGDADLLTGPGRERQRDQVHLPGVVPGQHGIRDPAPPGQQLQCRLGPGNPAVERRVGRQREVIGVRIVEPLRRADDILRIPRIDGYRGFAAGVLRVGIVRYLDVAIRDHSQPLSFLLACIAQGRVTGAPLPPKSFS